MSDKTRKTFYSGNRKYTGIIISQDNNFIIIEDREGNTIQLPIGSTVIEEAKE